MVLQRTCVAVACMLVVALLVGRAQVAHAGADLDDMVRLFVLIFELSMTLLLSLLNPRGNDISTIRPERCPSPEAVCVYVHVCVCVCVCMYVYVCACIPVPARL